MAEEKGYSTRRIELFERLGERRDELEGRLVPDPKTIRLKYGSKITELKVPYHMGGSDETAIEEAVTSLSALLARRFEPSGSDKSSSAPPLKEKTMRTDLFIAGSFEKALAEEILRTTPHMDSSLLASWLSPEGAGRRFTRWVPGFFDKMLKEEAASGGERTSYMALLAVTNTLAAKKEKVKGVRIRGLSYEKFDLALSLTIFTALRLSLLEAFRGLRERKAHHYTRAAEELLELALTPGHFISVRGSVFSTSLNPYGISGDVAGALKEAAPELGSGNLSALIEETAKRVKGDLRAMVKRQREIQVFRAEAFSFMSGLDIPMPLEQLQLIYGDDRLIGNCIDDPGTLGKIIEALEGARKMVERDPRRFGVISGFLDYLSSLRKGRRGDGGEAEVYRGFYAMKVDEQVERFTGLMRKSLFDKRGELTPEALMEEYRKGRVYRFSSDEREVLRVLEVEEEGQLFVDMKDFTRKTLRFKEIAMADFMKENFLKPILKAASRYSAGFGDESDLRLTNIPGDAVIFSGSARRLVGLARDIQEIIGNYREEVLKRLPGRKDRMLEEAHRRFEEKRAELKKRRMELVLSAGDEAAKSKLISLGEEEERLEASYREELEEAIRGELEAGLFISYGSKAEVISLDPVGDFSGEVNVSVAEKINEAARGTFRNLMVRTKLEMILAEEKKRRRKELRYPFDIYIDSTYSLRMPPEVEGAFEKLLSSRKPGTEEALVKLLSQEYLADLKRVVSGEPSSSLRFITSVTDIYNKGHALSEKALQAYMKETRREKRFFRRVVLKGDLDPEIRDAFFFPRDPLELWFGVEVKDGEQRAEAFCRSGEILFKGFEAGTTTVVYEMLDPRGEFFGLLMKKHFQRWYEEAKRKGGAEGGV